MLMKNFTGELKQNVLSFNHKLTHAYTYKWKSAELWTLQEQANIALN